MDKDEPCKKRTRQTAIRHPHSASYPSQLLPHLILPKRLPPHPIDCKIEDKFLKFMIHGLNQIKEIECDDENSYFDEILQILTNWSEYQTSGLIDVKFLNEHIKRLGKTGATSFLPIYIRSQNAGLVFSSSKCGCAGSINVSTFIASQSSEQIMITNGALVSVFPGISYSVPNSELFKSTSFSQLIELLTTVPQENAMPRITKANKEFIDDREPPDPVYISQWLPSILSNSESEVCPHVISVVKKIRDEVRMSTEIPFRRSGLWMTIKVFVQLHFVTKYGTEVGRLLYKLTVLHALGCGAKIWGSTEDSEYNLELIQKITRRLLKLEKYVNEHQSEISNSLLQLIKGVSEFAEDTSNETLRSIESDWKEIVKNFQTVSLIKELKCEGNFSVHSFDAVNKFIDTINCHRENKTINVEDLNSISLHRNADTIFPVDKFSNDSYHGKHSSTESVNNVVLHDFENFVKYKKLDKFCAPKHSEQIRNLFDNYLASAGKHYDKDPLGKSYMILVLLKILQILDKLTCEKYPLLLEYDPGINPAQIIKHLLLPQLVDLELAKDLEVYFNNRIENAEYASLIGETSVTYNSFSVVYAKDNLEMQRLKSKILQEIEVGIEKKKKEVELAKEEIQKLRNDAYSRQCEYKENRWGQLVHSHYCERHRLLSKADNYEIEVFEEYLPHDNEVLQNAIMFELLIPNEISYLRDSLLSFHQELFGEIVGTKGVGLWINYSKIGSYAKGIQKHLTLGSTTILVLNSHLRQKSPEHRDPEDFIVFNGYDVKPMVTASSCHTLAALEYNGNKIKTVSTLQVLSNSYYKSFQNYIHSTEHCVNEVYANQNLCPHELPIFEYRDFCSLRAGVYLQWHNIYRALSQGTISFENPSVVNLICQAIWEADLINGNDDRNTITREPFSALLDDVFVKGMIDLLSKTIDENEKNWKASHLLVCIILLGSKINSITKNDQLKMESANILLKCRAVALNWIKIIKTVTLQSTTSTVTSTTYKKYLFLAGLNVCLSFYVEIENLHFIMNVTEWVIGIFTVKENEMPEPDPEEKLYQRNMLRIVNRAAVNLASSLCDNEPIIHEGLDLFLLNYWQTSGIVGEWKREGQSQGFRKTIGDKIVQIDLLSGIFQINGNPKGHLPISIESHEEYQRVFGLHKFEVCPAPPTTSNCFQDALETVGEYDGCKYSFSMSNSTPRNPIIIERSIKNLDHEYVLIPHKEFEFDLPYLLIHNYSHWYSKSKSIIEFRSKEFTTSGFENTVKYTIDLNSNEIKSTNNAHLIVNIKSEICRDIITVLSRLESPKYIILDYDQKSNTLLSTLIRMGLHFKINLDTRPIELISQEYPDMKVTKVQAEYGTFIGLKMGLLLTDREQRNKMIPPILMIPYSNTIRMPRWPDDGRTSHRSITIVIPEDSPTTSTFFTYELDLRLKRLKAGQSQEAWLFMAYLHALTSSILPDPLTGMTGYESCIHLLQSAHCWSDKPYSATGIEILKAIIALSPQREYFPKHKQIMEKVRFLDGFYSYCLNDAYILIVDKLLRDCIRNPFEEEKVPINLWESTNKNLTIRSYQRHNMRTNEQNQISKSFTKLEESYDIRLGSAFKFSIGKIDLQDPELTRQVAHCYHNKHSAFEKNAYSVQFLLNEFENMEKLNGPSVLNEVQDLINQVPTISREIKNYWLTIYKMVINAEKEEVKHLIYILLQLLTQYTNTKVDKEYIKMFFCILQNQNAFKSIVIPSHESYENTNEICYYSSRNKIEEVLQRCFVGFATYFETQKIRLGFNNMSYEEREKVLGGEEIKYKSLKSIETSSLEKLIRKCWDQNNLNELEEYEYSSSTVFTSRPQTYIKQSINLFFQTWRNNIELKTFLTNVGTTVDNVTNITRILVQHFDENISTQQNRSLLNTFEVRMDELIGFEIDQLIVSYEGQLDTTTPLREELKRVFQTGQVYNCGDETLKEYMEVDNVLEEFPFTCDTKTDVNCKIRNDFLELFRDSWHQHQLDKMNPPKVYALGTNTMQENGKKLKMAFGELYKMFYKSANFNHNIILVKREGLVSASGLFPRLTEVNLIQTLLKNSNNKTAIVEMIGGIVVLWTYEQYFLRIQKLSINQSTLLLQKEKENPPHLNWSPKEKPEWLVLELEMDVAVRQVQAEVANSMIEPTEGNTVMQLNMGEGKTSVILPLCIASLANGDQLCRVIVLNPLFQMNFNALRNVLSGLLNRRVYSFPCSRDLEIDSNKAGKMLQLYEECQEKKGVFLTIPEHRLSFMLKVIEMCRSTETTESSHFNAVTKLLEVSNYLTENARDILDESDEICNVKYQLVYTVGKQNQIETTRHRITQGVLKIVPKYLKLIADEDHCMAECTDRNGNSYPICRIFNPECYERLCSLIVDDILKGNPNILITTRPGLNLFQKQTIKKFLVYKKTDKNIHEETLRIFEDALNDKNIILIMRGLLANGILLTCLLKRWRVNYGVIQLSINYSKTLMAVPFKANDVASEKTEFGHPDVAICFTQLSYYYSGLSDSQIKQAFQELSKLANSEEEQEYFSWLDAIPNRKVHPSISNIKGVNLDDDAQREEIIFPTFRFNLATIDFWLNHVVYPKESKAFAYKIMCSPWDLCGTNSDRPVTGFSGTNDTRLLLPLHMKQRDIPGLIGTNGKVLHNLLRKENNNYETLELGFSWKEFLKTLQQMNTTMLLDVGALMTQARSNEELITEWLSLYLDIKQIEAGVYFNSKNQLTVKDKQNRVTMFETSPYRYNLGCCLIYLDEWHTRGTDLRIPTGTKGAVTIGKGVTKDKLVQGCMRMRMLGNGHTLSFFSSHEVHNEILQLVQEGQIPGTTDVIIWALNNSITAIREGIPHWVNAGFNYMKKKIERLAFDQNSQDCYLKYQRFGEDCSDLEITSLNDMYGTFREEGNYVTIVKKNLDNFHHEIITSHEASISGVSGVINDIGFKILNNCSTYIPFVNKVSSSLDEEQIRELEPEKEEERQFDKLPKGSSYPSTITDGLFSSVKNGKLEIHPENFMKLPFALEKTSIWKYAQPESWGQSIYATKNFALVAFFGNSSLDLEDQFLREVQWILSFPVTYEMTEDRKCIRLLLISPYEANALFPILRKAKFAQLNSKVTLHMFSSKYHPTHEQLFENPKVCIPSRETVPDWLNRQDLGYLHLYSNLLFYTGSFYFANKAEQDVYCNFLGCIPGPRNAEEDQAFEDGLITKNGFVLPEHRKRFLNLTSSFVDRPQELVDLIVRTRYGHFPEKSHLYSIIFGSTKVFT